MAVLLRAAYMVGMRVRKHDIHVVRVYSESLEALFGPRYRNTEIDEYRRTLAPNEYAISRTPAAEYAYLKTHNQYIISQRIDKIKGFRVSLAITSNLKNSLFRAFACWIARRTPGTPSHPTARNHRKILVFKARSVFAVKMTR